MYQSYKKYDETQPIIHCKACRGVLLIIKDVTGHSSGEIKFETRCPHCKKDWSIKIIVDEAPIIELTDHGVEKK